MKETLKLGIILLIITVVSAGVLAMSNNLTKDKIAQIEIENSLSALKDIFGDGYDFKDMDANEQEKITSGNAEIVEITEVYKDEILSGYAIKTVSGGYSGNLIVLTGISVENDEIVGMRLLEHTETPTLGGKAEKPDYYNRFPGEDISEEVKVEVVSGATVTSNGVIKGVNTARDLYNNVLTK